MEQQHKYEVIVIGGSFAGLAAAMALGRALRKVLVIDAGMPCNRFSPQAHNFISRDGTAPTEITAIAKEEVLRYSTVSWETGRVVAVNGSDRHFCVETSAGGSHKAGKLLFATGLQDNLPGIPGLAECWGISVLHCPYCHGYEKRGKITGILHNGTAAFEFARLIRQWTPNLHIFSNGPLQLTEEERTQLAVSGIAIDEREVAAIGQENGVIQQIRFKDGSAEALEALYVRAPWVQQTDIPKQLGCAFTEEGLIGTDALSEPI